MYCMQCEVLALAFLYNLQIVNKTYIQRINLSVVMHGKLSRCNIFPHKNISNNNSSIKQQFSHSYNLFYENDFICRLIGKKFK